MYAIVRVGGKQYRVEKGDSLVVDRMREDEGAKVTLEPLLFRSDDDRLRRRRPRKVKVEAAVKGHERGEKIRILKFKPKRGYKRRAGHRSEQTVSRSRDIKMLCRASPPRRSRRRRPRMAHKKGLGSSRNGRDSKRSASA